MTAWLQLCRREAGGAPTFYGGVGGRALYAQVPRRVSLVSEVPHLQVADGEADDGGFVQLAGDGSRERQHLGQLVELKVLLPPPRASSVPGLLLPQSLQPETQPGLEPAT